MFQRFHCGLAALTVVLGSPAALVAEPASQPAVLTVESADAGCCTHHKGAWFGWFKGGHPKVRDDGYERRKESCRFIFGPAGPYLHPNLYRPWPPLIGYSQ